MQIAPPPVRVPSEAETMPDGLSRALAKSKGNRTELERAGKELDAYFISYLLKTMRETVPKGFLNNKHGEQFYYFYDMEIGRLAAERGGLGFKALVLEDAAKQQSVDNSQDPSSSGSAMPILETSR